MLQHVFARPNGDPYCTTEYDEANGWLRATWRGFVTAQDGVQGAVETAKLLQITHCPYLLNDNSHIEGPWFDSVEWLQRVWAPQAGRLGLRYVAHVFQPHTDADAIRQQLDANPFAGMFELQFFDATEAAEKWLRECQALVNGRNKANEVTG